MDDRKKYEIMGEIRKIRLDLGMKQSEMAALVFPDFKGSEKSWGNKIGKIENGVNKNEADYYIVLDKVRQVKREREDAMRSAQTDLFNQTNNDKGKDEKNETWTAEDVCKRLDRLIKAVEGITNAIYVTDKRRRETEKEGADHEEK